MPTYPKWFADTIEAISKKYYHPVKVTQTEYLKPQLKRIRFEGKDLINTQFTAGNAVQFRLSDNEYRHYTPSLYDSEKGICDIIIYLHDKGIGSKWANNLKIGDEIKLIGPGGRLRYLEEYKKHFVFGDETSIGLVMCMSKAIRDNNQEVLCLLEIKKKYDDWKNLLDNSVLFAESSFENPAQSAIDKLTNTAELWKDISKTCFYLTGRTKSIQLLRKFLLSKGVNSKQIKTDPFWAEGKKGL